jgi:hypothetical protein
MARVGGQAEGKACAAARPTPPLNPPPPPATPGAATAMLNYYRAFLRTLTLANQPGDDKVWE